jgi:DNA-binding Xre family transcriptional regulator
MGKRRGDRTYMIKLRVREVAQAKGISMAKLGRMADLNQRTMQAIYNDPYRDVAYSTLVKLAKALDVDIAELTEEVSDGDKK